MAARAKRNLAGVILDWPPPFRPHARAAARPTLVRSETNSRSNSAKAAKIPNTSLPSGVVVLIDAPCPVSTWKPTPLVVRSCTVLMRWRKLRPKRSSFHTRSVSPSRSTFRQAVRPGRAETCPSLRHASPVTARHRRSANAPRPLCADPSATLKLPTQRPSRTPKHLSNLPRLASHR